MQQLAQDPREVPAALLRAQILFSLVTFGRLDALDQLVIADGWTKERSGGFQGGLSSPACYYFLADTGDLFIFVGGVNSTAKGQELWNGYLGNYLLPNDQTQNNPYFVNTGKFLWDNLIKGVRYPRQCVVAAHSAGGGTAIELMKLMQADFSSHFPALLCAFGVPSPGHQADITASGFATWCHWMNTDDAVPLIPPSITQYERIVAGISTQQANWMSTFAFLGGGIQIGLAGQINAGNSPASNPVPATAQIGNWLAQQEAGLETPHSLNVYVARLVLAVGPLPSAPVIAPTAQPTIPVIPPTHTQIAQAMADTVQTQFNDATRQNAVPVNIPEEALFIAQRTGKVWYVMFGGVQIAVAPHKRRARALARLGNDWLRRLQNEAVVYTDDLASQFAAYLQIASDPTSGFTPTINTETSA